MRCPRSTHIKFLALLGFVPAIVIAAECSVPYLAPGFCDRNGDLVADSPTDKAQWIDPDPVVIGVIATNETASREGISEAFLRHLESKVGRKVISFPVQSLADLMSALRANRAHVLSVNAGSVVQTVQCSGIVPIAQALDDKGNVSGYRMEIIVPSGSRMTSAKDLKGSQITFVDETSNSGYKAPRSLLAKQFGLEAGRDYQFNFSGRQDNSILGVANGVYEAAAAASNIRENLQKEGMVPAKAIRVIYSSPTFPRAVWSTSNRLSPTLIDKFRAAFVSYQGAGDSMSMGSRFKVADYKNDWQIMRDLDASGPAGVKCP